VARCSHGKVLFSAWWHHTLHAERVRSAVADMPSTPRSARQGEPTFEHTTASSPLRPLCTAGLTKATKREC
jgi:hypothetical protein